MAKQREEEHGGNSSDATVDLDKEDFTEPPIVKAEKPADSLPDSQSDTKPEPLPGNQLYEEHLSENVVGKKGEWF